MFKGIIPALPTPFYRGEVDEDSLRSLIAWLLESGVHGLVPCGTTGETPTLTHDEYEKVIRITLEEVKGRVPVVPGAGANTTAKAVDLAHFCRALGADGTLQVAPYYNKPSQEGMFRHFQAVAQTKLPMIVYNVPGRTGVNILPQTLNRLTDLPEVKAVKEASGDIGQMSEIRRLCRDRLILLTGDDALTLPVLSIGGQGVVSVAANLLPTEMVDLFTAWETGDIQKAQQTHLALHPVMTALFIESNPVPLKTALAAKGLIRSPEVRLPLSEMTEANQSRLFQVLKSSGF